VPEAVPDGRKALGADGEEEACRLLRGRGYRVLERNYRTRWGELDAVALEAGELVFVEVRSRSTGEFGSGAESVGPAKQRQLVRMAQMYMSDRRVPPERVCRFDVVEMQPLPEGGWRGSVVRDAFQAG
jgi:putative endonuclease